MKKKFIALLMAATIIMTGCGNNNTSENANNTQANEQTETIELASTEAEPAEEIAEPIDLTGTWKSENNDGNWMEAEISNGVITINWVSDNGDTKSIYWVGTYVAPEEYTEEFSWTSERDKEKTDGALMASTDDTKEFSYANEEISYEASAAGTTKIMHLKKSE